MVHARNCGALQNETIRSARATLQLLLLAATALTEGGGLGRRGCDAVRALLLLLQVLLTAACKQRLLCRKPVDPRAICLRASTPLKVGRRRRRHQLGIVRPDRLMQLCRQRMCRIWRRQLQQQKMQNARRARAWARCARARNGACSFLPDVRGVRGGAMGME